MIGQTWAGRWQVAARTRGAAAVGRYAGEAAWVASGQALTLLGAAALLKALATALPPGEFGRLNLLTTAILLPTWLLLAPVSQAALRRYARSREEGATAPLLRATMLVYASVIGATWLAVALAAEAGALRATGFSPREAELTALLFGLDGWTAMALGLSGAARRRRHVALVTAAGTWLRVALVLALESLGGAALPSVLAVFAAAAATSAVVATWPLAPELSAARRSSFDPALFRSMLAYGAPFGAWSVFAWLQAYVDRYAVGLALGAPALGAYVAAVQVASMPFGAAAGVLSQFVTPIVYETAGTGDDPGRLRRADRFLLAVLAAFAAAGALVVVAYALGGEAVVRLLADARYVQPGALVALLAAGSLLATLGQQATLLLLARNRPASLIPCKVAPGLVGVLLVYGLASRWGLAGAAAGYAVVGAVSLVSVAATIRWVDGGAPGFGRAT